MTGAGGRLEGWAFPAGVLVATLLGAALRVLHLEIPLRYDEAVTYLDYASSGLVHAASHYPTPNNHVLNSVLIHGLTSLLGPHPWVVRLPAFLAGCLLVPATAWMAARRFERRVGVAAAFLVAATPVLVEYSTNARGYSIVALATVTGVAVAARLLHAPGSGRGWAAFAALMILGTYAVPVMLMPWMGLTLWLWVNLFVGEGTLRERLRREVPLVVATLAAAVAVAALYAPVVIGNGLDALVGNRFVTALDWDAFLGSVPATVVAVGRHWIRAVPAPLAALAGIGVIAGLVLRPGERGRFPLGWALVLGVLEIMLVKRNAGEARIWLWALPLVLTASAAGLVAFIDRTLRPSLAPRVATAVAGAWATLVAAHLVVERPLWRSLETGGFMEVEEVAAWLAGRVEPRDAVVTDFVSWEPLRYYLARHEIDPAALEGAPAQEGRAWIVLNQHEPERAARTGAQAARFGLPLEIASPMATFGQVQIFGFGRGAPASRGTAEPEGDAAGGSGR